MKKRLAYFIGIKGAGMAALAQIFKNENWQVFGSDIKEKFFTDKILKKAKIKVFNGFSEKNIPKKADIYIASNAYLAKDTENPEIIFLRDKNKKIYSYPEALSKLFNKKYGIAIAGTHGKSTTTSMVGVVFEKAGLSPNVLVGAEVLNWRSNIFLGKGNHFIIEADEYKSAFLNYHPKILAINSVEYDHPDFFKNKKDYLDNFLKFSKLVKRNGKIIVNREVSIKLFKKKFKKENLCVDIFNKNLDFIFSVKATNIRRDNLYQIFDVSYQNRVYKNFKIRVGGIYLKNAILAIAISLVAGIKEDKLRMGIFSYKGTGRRFEVKKINQLFIVDDFAHHPTAIKETINLAREIFSKRKIVIIFQGHTFSRVKKFLKGFTNSLKEAEKIIILPIFSSAREKKETIKPEVLGKILKEEKKDVFLAKNFLEAGLKAKEIIGNNPNHYLVVLIGAGDVYKMKEVFKKLLK